MANQAMLKRFDEIEAQCEKNRLNAQNPKAEPIKIDEDEFRELGQIDQQHSICYLRTNQGW